MTIKINNTHLIHTVLGHSYMVSVVFFCLAIFFDQVYPLAFNILWLESLGLVLVLFGTCIAFWAQRSAHVSARARYGEMRTPEAFMFGPYRYVRAPTQFALFLLVAGLGFAVNIAWVSIFAVLSFSITYAFFIKKQERILIKRYGESYEQYRSKVRF